MSRPPVRTTASLLAAALLLACGGTTAPGDAGELHVRWAAIAAGGSDFSAFSCGLTDAGVAYCWGDNLSGQLGADVEREARVPMRVKGDLTFRSLALGSRHACGSTVDGAVHCWGLWIPSEQQQPRTLLASPRVMAGAHGFGRLAAGLWSACGVADTGAALCWSGHPTHHEEYRMSSTPQPVPGGLVVSSVAAGWHFGDSYWCALTGDGAAHCWGSNLYGTLGDGSYGPGTNRAEPAPVAGGLSFVQLDAGYIACGVVLGGAVYCWGPENSYPPFAGNVAGGTTPARLHGGVSFQSVSVGAEHACGLDAGGLAYCWGRNDQGQLGNGSAISGSNTPVQVAGGLAFRSLSAGNGHTCGVTAGGEAYCWGANGSGQLGDGSARSSAPLDHYSRIPVRVRVMR